MSSPTFEIRVLTADGTDIETFRLHDQQTAELTMQTFTGADAPAEWPIGSKIVLERCTDSEVLEVLTVNDEGVIVTA